MIKSMYSGVSGLRSHQTKMDVVANNISNVNTIGYKSSSVAFQDVFSQTLQTSTASTDSVGGINAKQVGLGVSLASIDSDFSAGNPQSTGSQLDVALSGEGFFMLQDATGQTVYTRVGHFKVDENGALVNSNGLYVLDSDEGTIDLSDYTNWTINQNGEIYGVDSSGETQNTGIIVGVSNFSNPNGLEKLGNSTYKQTDVSGVPLNDGDLVAGENGTGLLTPGYLEMSNVDLAKEFTEMIVTQRGYQANSRVITTSDTLLEELINLKR